MNRSTHALATWAVYPETRAVIRCFTLIQNNTSASIHRHLIEVHGMMYPFRMTLVILLKDGRVESEYYISYVFPIWNVLKRISIKTRNYNIKYTYISVNLTLFRNIILLRQALTFITRVIYSMA